MGVKSFYSPEGGGRCPFQSSHLAMTKRQSSILSPSCVCRALIYQGLRAVPGGHHAQRAHSLSSLTVSESIFHLDIWTTSTHRRPLQLCPDHRGPSPQPEPIQYFMVSSLTPPRVTMLLDTTCSPRPRLQTSSMQRPRAILRNPVPTRTPTLILNAFLLLLHLPATMMDTCDYRPAAKLGRHTLDSQPERTWYRLDSPCGRKIKCRCYVLVVRETCLFCASQWVLRTVGERLQPTMDQPIMEKYKYREMSPGGSSNLPPNTDGKLYASNSALYMRYAISLQVFLGALMTGLAAALTIGRQASC